MERIRTLMGVSLLAGLTALGAQIAVPLPGTPVPMTLQVLTVLLSGLLLGAERGALSQVLYLAAGVAGLPVFASTTGLPAILGPTGGYLIAFPAVAFSVGTISRRLNHLPGYLLAAAGGVGVLYAGGVLWLALWLGMAKDPWAMRYPVTAIAFLVRAWRLGVMPFVLVDLAKGVLAALVADRGRRHMSLQPRRREGG